MTHELKFTIQHNNILVLEGAELKQLIQAYQKGNFTECYIRNWLIDCDSFSLGNLYYIEYRNKMGNMVRYSDSRGTSTFEFIIPFNHADKFTCVFYSFRYDMFADCHPDNPYIKFVFIEGYKFSYSQDGQYRPIPPDQQKIEPLPKFKIGGTATFYLEMETNMPVLHNVTYSRQNDLSRYVLNFNSSYANYHEVKIYTVDSNGLTSLKKTLNINNTVCYVDYADLQNGVNLFEITAVNYDKVSNVIRKEFNHYVPEVSSIKIQNDTNLIDSPSIVTWKSKNQERAEILVNDKLVGSVAKQDSFIINKGIFSKGKNVVKIIIYSLTANTLDGGSCSSFDEEDITLDRIMPTCDNVTINETNTDKKITVSWQSTNQSYAIILDNNKEVARANNGLMQATINEGVLSPNTKKLVVRVFYNSGFDTVFIDKEIDVTLTQNTPIIYNVEPSNLAIDTDTLINVTFATNEFCDRWVLNANTLTTQGTTDRKVVFGQGTFFAGNNTLTLTIYYSPPYNKNIVRTATKTVTFYGYGTPQPPILDSETVYTNAKPTINWQSQEQTSYQVIVEKEGTQIIDTGIVISTDMFYSFTSDLEDDSNYTIKVRYKNRYKWSAYSSKDFSTKFNDIILPDFYLLEMNNGVQITISGIQDRKFKSASILRKSENEENWIEIAYDCNSEDSIFDYTCPASVNVQYKLRVYDVNNGYTDSLTKDIKIKLLNYHFTNLVDFTETYRLDFVEPSFSINSDIVSKTYAKQSKPRVYKGYINYITGSFTAKLANADAVKFINFIQNSNEYNTFCYRDWKGGKLYVVVSITDVTPENQFVQNVSFEMTEINYTEDKMYKGSGLKKVVYLNGDYNLDGSIDLSGYDLNYVLP